MPFASTFGFAVGVGITCFKNGLQYLPAYRKPWEHVIAGTATAYLFQWIVDQEESLVKQIQDHYSRMSEQKQQ